MGTAFVFVAVWITFSSGLLKSVTSQSTTSEMMTQERSPKPKMNVTEPASTEPSTSSTSTCAGDTTVLRCPFQGNPAPNVTWFGPDGAEVQTNENVITWSTKSDASSGNSSLVIVNTSEEYNEMTYTCHSTPTNCSFAVLVPDPGSAVGQVNLTTQARTCSVSWVAIPSAEQYQIKIWKSESASTALYHVTSDIVWAWSIPEQDVRYTVSVTPMTSGCLATPSTSLDHCYVQKFQQDCPDYLAVWISLPIVFTVILAVIGGIFYWRRTKPAKNLENSPRKGRKNDYIPNPISPCDDVAHREPHSESQADGNAMYLTPIPDVGKHTQIPAHATLQHRHPRSGRGTSRHEKPPAAEGEYEQYDPASSIPDRSPPQPPTQHDPVYENQGCDDYEGYADVEVGSEYYTDMSGRRYDDEYDDVSCS